MLCKNCGAQIADDSVFCTSCGFRVRPVSEAVQENAAVTAEQMPVQTEQAVQESATAENTVQAESIQESAAAENTAQAEPIQESTAAENAAQTEPIQESATAENTVQAESIQESIDAENGTQAENAAQEGAADGSAQPDSMPGEQPQMNNVPNGQMAYGQPQMNGMPNGQMAYGQPQAGSIPNGVPYGQAMKQPKKPFVMPAAVNVAGGILAIAAVAVFVCVLLFGKPEEKKSDLVVGTLAIPAQQQAVEGSDYLDIDLSNVTYQLEIPETDGYRAAQELAEGYIFADSDTRYLREWDLYTYSGSELWHAYFEILAREGVDVSEIDEEEHEYFQRKSWYDPTISLIDILMEMDEDQVARYSEMIENEKNPIGEILLDAGILNETEVFNMELIEEYLTLGTTTMEGPGDALEDMLEE